MIIHEQKKIKLWQRKKESKISFEKKIVERTALQKSSSQFICGGFPEQLGGTQERVSSAINTKKMLGKEPYNFIENCNKAVSELTQESTLKYARARSATYRVLKKDASIWNDFTKTPLKQVKMSYTNKVIRGEEEAIDMISKRKDEQEEKNFKLKRDQRVTHDEIMYKRLEKHTEFTERCSQLGTFIPSKRSHVQDPNVSQQLPSTNRQINIRQKPVFLSKQVINYDNQPKFHLNN